MEKVESYKIEKNFLMYQLIVLALSLIIFYLISLFTNDLRIAIIIPVALNIIATIIGLGGAVVNDALLEQTAGAAGTASVTGIVSLGILLLKAKQAMIIISLVIHATFLGLGVVVIVLGFITIMAVNNGIKNYTIEVKRWIIYLAYLIQIIVISTLAYLFL